jgi:putative oxidoreductase
MNNTTDAGLSARWAAWAPYAQSLLRITAAFAFFLHGSMKLLAIPASVMPAGGTLPLGSLPGVAGLLELVGGALLLFGLFTRPVAFIVAGEMAVAYFMAHASKGLWPNTNGGELAMLFCFIWLYFSAAGGGAWSLDAMRGGKR